MNFDYWETRIVICCALKEEMVSVKAQFKRWVPSFSGWHINEDYPTFTVRFECFNKMGPENAAAHTTKLISLYEPRVFMLCGIMGGFEERGVKEGDVVVGKRVIGYDEGKLTNKGKVRRWEVYPQPAAFWGLATNYRDERPSSNSRVHVGDIISGKSVWATNTLPEVKNVKEAWDKALGVEMEALGMCVAIYEPNVWDLPALLVIKGVSDKAGPDKVDNRLRKIASKNSGKVASKLIAALGETKRRKDSYIDVGHRLQGLRSRLVRSYHNSGHFIENLNNPSGYAQKWTTADVALGFLCQGQKINASVNIESIVRILLTCDDEPGGYCVEQFPTYPMTTVTSTVGLALHHLGCLTSRSPSEEAFAGYARVVQRLQKMRLASGAWSFCELVEPRTKDARVWDTVHAVYCCLCEVAANKCEATTTSLVQEMAEDAIKWLHATKRNAGWFNKPAEGTDEVSLILTVIVSAVIMVGRIILRKPHLGLDESFIKSVLTTVSSERDLVLIERLRAEDAKLVRKSRDADYGKVVEKASMFLSPALLILSQALDYSPAVSAETRSLCKYIAKSVLYRFLPQVERMSLFVPSLVLQGVHLWKHYMEMANGQEKKFADSK